MKEIIHTCYHYGDSPMIKMEDGNYICEMCRAVTLSVENNVKQIIEGYEVHVFDKNSVNIDNSHFNFMYIVADSVLKDEFKGQYRYFGGLQSNLKQDTEDYKLLEKTLCEIAEKELELFCNNTTHSVSVTGN